MDSFIIQRKVSSRVITSNIINVIGFDIRIEYLKS